MGENKDTFKINTIQSFQAIKQDIQALNIRIQLLEAENRRLKQELEEEKESKKEESQESLKVSAEKKESQELRQIIRETVEEALTLKHTREPESLSNQKIREENTQTQISIQEPQEIKYTPKPKVEKIQKDNLKEDLIRSYERNRKNIIKQQILTESNKGSYSKVELRDIIVNQKKYCSKASFYRYLEELELEQLISYKRRKKKTIIEAAVIQQ